MPGSQRSSGSFGPTGREPGPDGTPPRETGSLLLAGARLADGRTVDVRLHGERIEAVGTAGSLAPRGGQDQRLDLSGYLLLPAPAEVHAHLGTALTAEATEGAGPGGPPPPDEDVQRRVTEAALLQLGYGATAVRTHVHIGGVQGLRTLEAVVGARRALRDLVDVSAVAVPRVLTGAAGADGMAMLRDALTMGADVVGGCPDLDPDPSGYAEAVLRLAAEFGCPVDLHSDAADPARLARLAAMAGGLRPGVVVGPCAGLGRLSPDALSRAADRLAAAGVAVVCLPQGGCGVVERRLAGLAAPVRALRAAGVRVAAGGGALRDVANPVGRADPLESAYLLASWGEASAGAAYAAVSAVARSVMGLGEVRVEAGFPAELLAVRGRGVAGVLASGVSRVVVHRGRVVSRTSAVREFADTAVLGLPRQGERAEG
jgi:cytosine/creatinine deaminase